MAEINLLPEEKSKSFSVKAGLPIRRIINSILLLVSIGVILYAGFFVFVFIEGRMVNQTNDDTKKEIKALETTEQKYTLLRDRIKKAEKILSAPSASDEAQAFSEIQKRIPGGTILKEIELQPTAIRITAKAQDSVGISEFLRSLVSLGQFKQIELTNLTFSPKDRYLMEIKIVDNSK